QGARQGLARPRVRPQLLLGRQGRRDLRLRRIPRAVLRTPRSPGAGPSGFGPQWSRTRAGPGWPWPPRPPGAGPERAGPERDGPERGRDEDTRPRAAHRRRHGRTIDEHPVDRHQLEDEQDSRRGPRLGPGPARPPGRCRAAGVQPFVSPSFTATTAVAGVLGTDSPGLLGVQNAHWEDAGAWTGEVSVPQAKDAGAQIVEIGPSERREHFRETVETTRRKVAAALRHGLTP